MSQWFRMYAEVLNDPKAQRLRDADFRGWVNVLCLACQHDGVIPSDDDIAFALRIDVRKAKKLMETLAEAGLIDVTETGRAPHNWSGRQYKSDVSTDRVKRFRNAKRNVSQAVTETPPDTETEQSVPLSNDNGAKPDSDKAFWDSAKSYLGPSKASLIGKWAKEYGQEATASAITAAQLERAINPVEFIQGHFRANRPKQPAMPI
jgi:hypothetical protein